METSTEESKVTVNNNDKGEIFTNGVQVEEVNSFKDTEATIPKDDSSMAEVPIRIGTATSGASSLHWYSSSSSSASKYRLSQSLV